MQAMEVLMERAAQLLETACGEEDRRVAAYNLGKVLDQIHRRRLWEDRCNRLGRTYTRFDEFVAGEFGLHHGTAFQLMDVADHYTEAQVRRHGVEKLYLLLRAPRPETRRIMGAIVAGASAREVKSMIRRARRRARIVGEKRATGRKVVGVPS